MIELLSPQGTTRALINPSGAALSEFWLGDIQVVGSPDIYSGVPLFPWPNRISNGVWNHDGRELQLPINDSQQNAALHGLVFQNMFAIDEVTENSCALSTVLESTTGFPFKFRLSVNYKISNKKIEIVYSVNNLSNRQAPFAIGFHPYFVADAESIFSTERTESALGSVHKDETLGPALHAATLNTAKYRLEVKASDTEYLHVFTNRYSNPDFIWFAIEPQSAPADSLKSGVGVFKLEPMGSQDFSFELVVQ